jgi:solute carrier family 25 S-adenosylmethionine transporter 26
LLQQGGMAVGGEEEKPFNFLQILCEGVIAGGTAGVVVETALYPIDTIKTRLQVIQFSHHAVLQVSTFDHHI